MEKQFIGSQKNVKNRFQKIYEEFKDYISEFGDNDICTIRIKNNVHIIKYNSHSDYYELYSLNLEAKKRSSLNLANVEECIEEIYRYSAEVL